MKIILGSDHAGFKLKEHVKKYLSRINYPFSDFGTYTLESVDYVDIAVRVAEEVVKAECFGILICHTGIGMSIAANKVRGVRAALCSDVYTAKKSKEHNNANILVLGSKKTSKALAERIIKSWLRAKFAMGRHQRRVNKIRKLEKK